MFKRLRLSVIDNEKKESCMITSATIQNQGVWKMNSEKQTRWLWYPGDFEIRQGLLQNFSREERGYD